MTTITPDDYLNGDIIAALKTLRSLIEIIEYQKIESDEFLKLPELGICFHADNSGEISDIRIYLKEADGFFAAEDHIVNNYLLSRSIAEATIELGGIYKDIPSIRIPGMPNTHPARKFAINSKLYNIYYETESNEIISIIIRDNIST
ncbi:hypothetical protein RHP75_01025 [Pseudomonas sp. SG20056]|uniref:hypothetical protein n=1 Tax=Pseudomonas sp. SG20056 TaxID=3074146 RepID=UPI00287F50EB|nr:hypothetical protein [Pseudomonas sp. SG20056]WNF47050.1 hypothetical protein RHP75_01025 [Pseudomonas sp. SG20056]